MQPSRELWRYWGFDGVCLCGCDVHRWRHPLRLSMLLLRLADSFRDERSIMLANDVGLDTINRGLLRGPLQTPAHLLEYHHVFRVAIVAMAGNVQYMFRILNQGFDDVRKHFDPGLVCIFGDLFDLKDFGKIIDCSAEVLVEALTGENHDGQRQGRLDQVKQGTAGGDWIRG